MNSSQDPAQIFGYDVNDSSGNKIGKVDNVWVDDATNELEFVGVKTGWLMGKTHVIPVANAQIADGSIQVPFDEERIKNAPSFSGDDELSPDQEDEIYSYYGEGRSTAASPSGLPTGTGTGYSSDTMDTVSSDYGTGTSGVVDNATDDQSLTLHEEELEVGKREVESGRVRLRKMVHTEHQEVPVELRREEVQIERVPATGDYDNTTAFQEQEIDVPLTREEAVVGKESHATEQVRLNKTVSTETENVGGDVRREDVVEDDSSGTSFAGQGVEGTTTRDSSY
jgi:uncharacterized protein (TIGR02271 family)